MSDTPPPEHDGHPSDDAPTPSVPAHTDSLPFLRLGNYRVIARLGEGGMGEVYLARDVKLERNVALKLLLEEFVCDADRLHRFEREARILASLNHPNIATVFSLEETETGSRVLALEFVEGEDLSQKLARRPLTIRDTLDIATQVADALDAAHERQVVHRDLKPSNIMVAKNGEVKVVDFGLACSISRADSHTRPDHIVGSAGYMSPEQLQDEEVDHRADIFAFGTLLFEALTGQRAFGGPTWPAVAAATLSKEPRWSLLPTDTPRALHDLIAHCVRKAPTDRPQSMADVRSTLDTIRRGSAEPTTTAIPAAEVQHNLPHSLTSFVGRDALVTELAAHMKTANLITLTGPGGTGKSRTALRLAETLLGRFPDGVWFVELAQLDDPDRVPHALAKVLDVKEESTRGLTEALTETLHRHRALIILDNCEHLLEACGHLATELRARCPGVQILATSRELLGVPGEQVIPVPALEPDEAVRLFTERARLVVHGFSVTDENTDTISRICRRLDGIPLALELAAARTRVLPADQIEARLDNRFQLLAVRGRYGLPHHKTLRATIDWSYDLLRPPERQLLRRVAAFTGGWSLEALAGMYEDESDEMTILECLTQLVDRSLIVVETGRRGTSRYRLLESVREYGREKLQEEGEGDDTRDRHLDHFVAFGKEAERNLRGPDQVRWLESLELEHDNLLAALDWSTTSPERAQKGLRLGGAIWPYWEVRGFFDVGIQALTRAIEADGDGQPTRARAGAITGAGSLAWNAGDTDGSNRFHEAALAIWRLLDVPRGIAVSLGNLGLVATQLRDFPLARERYRECLRIFRELDNRLGVAKTLGNLAIVARQEEDPEQAIALNEESLAIREDIGDRRGVAIACSNLARATFDIGDHQRCRAYLRRTFPLGKEIGDRVLVSGALETCATLLAFTGEPLLAARLQGAKEVHREALGITDDEPEELLEKLRSELDPGVLEEEWARGRKLSLSEATAEAMTAVGAA